MRQASPTNIGDRYSTQNRSQLLTSDSDHIGEVGLFSSNLLKFYLTLEGLPFTPGG